MAASKFAEERKRTEILHKIIVCFCFVCFPLFVVFVALEHSYRFNILALRENTVKDMQKRLDIIETHSDQKRYIHLLLKHIFDLCEKSDEPKKVLKQNIENLKSKYPKMLKFVVWNDKGVLEPDLNDLNKYRSVVNMLYASLCDVSEALLKNERASIKEIKSLKKERMKFFKRLLGRYLIVEDLRLPYLTNPLAGPFLVDYKKDFSYVWYRIGKKISFMCLINDKLLSGHGGLNKIVRVLNRSQSKYICGYSLAPDIEKSAVSVPESFVSPLALALARFENSESPIFENDSHIILMNIAQPDVRAFVAVKKDYKHWSRTALVYVPSARFAVLLLLFYLVLIAFFKLQTAFFSIGHKLTALFLMASMAPLSILAFVSHEYLNNKTGVLKNEAKIELRNFIKDFDNRYTFAQNRVAAGLNEILKPLKERSKTQTLTKNDFAPAEAYMRSLGAAEGYIVASSGAVIFNLTSDKHVVSKGNILIEFARSALEYNNGTYESEGSSRGKEGFDVSDSVLKYTYSSLLKNSRNNCGSAAVYSLLMYTGVYFWEMFGDGEHYNNDYFLILSWDNVEFQKKYLDLFYNDSTKNAHGITFYARSPEGLKTWPTNKPIPKELLDLMNKLNDITPEAQGEIATDGSKQVAVCVKGVKLNTVLFGALYPTRLIDEQTGKTRNFLLLGAVLSIFLTLIICQELSSHFLKPINALGTGAHEIAARNFAYRIPIYDKDEFGQLNSVFNHVAEGLADLEVARLIQENLFAPNRFETGSFSIYGKSVVMTSLGGDYYDCFEINGDYWGIVIGDVAGHGIPAGLMMAMAKGGVLTASEEEKLNPVLLTSRLHKIFFSIKNDKLKRMMTLQYFVFNRHTGEFSFANAGHCFPIVVKPKEGKATLINHVAPPLGIGRKPRLANYNFVIEPGEALFLYTDGIAEAKNKEGEEFGYERLCEAVLKSYTSSSEDYYNAVFAIYKNWINEVTDDLTLLIVTRTPNDKQ